VIQKRWALGVALLLVGSVGLLVLIIFQPRVYSMDDAFSISERYLTSLNNPDLAISEIARARAFNLNARQICWA